MKKGMFRFSAAAALITYAMTACMVLSSCNLISIPARGRRSRDRDRDTDTPRLGDDKVTETAETSSETSPETTSSSASSQPTTEATVTNDSGEVITLTTVNSDRENIGSATELSGRILVVSIFTDDEQGNWDLDQTHDSAIYDAAITDLEVATTWLTERAADYGREVEFIWDFRENDRLSYNGWMGLDAFETIYTPDYIPFYELIDHTVDEEGLLQYYDADSILYVLFFDDPYDEDHRTCACPYYGEPMYDYELCLFNMNDAGYTTGPASLAHEMLHLFGAPDLYYVTEWGVGITQEYINDAERHGFNDIMYTVYDPYTGVEHPDRIVNEITDITAYYVGLIDHSDTVEEWGFDESEHVS